MSCTPEREQELRDALHAAMARCDQREFEVVALQMTRAGLDPRAVGANALLDLDEAERAWWLEPRPGPVVVSVAEAVEVINEAARREAARP